MPIKNYLKDNNNWKNNVNKIIEIDKIIINNSK